MHYLTSSHDWRWLVSLKLFPACECCQPADDGLVAAARGCLRIIGNRMIIIAASDRSGSGGMEIPRGRRLGSICVRAAVASALSVAVLYVAYLFALVALRLLAAVLDGLLEPVAAIVGHYRDALKVTTEISAPLADIGKPFAIIAAASVLIPLWMVQAARSTSLERTPSASSC
jgi:hypothetical protein